jgi:ABC-type transport system substrate-binding protein
MARKWCQPLPRLSATGNRPGCPVVIERERATFSALEQRGYASTRPAMRSSEYMQDRQLKQHLTLAEQRISIGSGARCPPALHDRRGVIFCDGRRSRPAPSQPANQGIVTAAPRQALRQDAPVVEGAEISVPFDAYGQAITLDPHRSADYGGFWVMYPNVWGGFLRYDEFGRIALDLAEQVVRSQDGLRYTFTIREGATYASGNPVLADHFIASWTRALDPANLSPMVAFMEPLRGYDAWINGEADAELGFRAEDDRTVVVELTEPATYFPSFLASFVWSVVDPAVLEASGDENFVLNGAGTGPWQFTEYERDTRFVMDRTRTTTTPCLHH